MNTPSHISRSCMPSDIDQLSAVLPLKFSFSIDEVVRYTGIGRTTVYDQIRRGVLIARKAGKRTVVLRSELIAWLTSLPTAKG